MSAAAANPQSGPDRPGTDDWNLIDVAVADRLASAFQLPGGIGDLNPLASMDSAAMMPAVAKAALGVVGQPALLARVALKAATAMAQTTAEAGVRAVSGPPADEKRERERRFADPTWSGNAAYWWLKQAYRTCETSALDLVRSSGVDEATRNKAEFLVQSLIDAMAPTNIPLLNPAVRKRALETGGRSLARGAQNFIDDVRHNNGRPRQVMEGVYEVGKDMACSPGKVVFRNDLMELIQYAPSTKTVHEIPLLISPPWINKYYVMDLAPDRSLVQWAVDHGHTVFMISYRNPDETMRGVSMDDYLISGPVEALRVIGEITGAERVNLLALCLGGTLAMSTLAYLDALGEEHTGPAINSATFLNTLIDFSEPGILGVFTDEVTVSRLEKSMAKTGFLPKEDMQHTFNMLRANDLIWNYVVSNWMMGEDPPAFDLLTWNNDSTRMPAAMHSFYLRNCYLENRLAKGTLELAGTRLDPAEVDQDLYFLAAEQDHIAPWRSSYIGARLPKGKVRFVLSNSGHIAGIVNPPNPKSVHYVREDGALPESSQEWLDGATKHAETWWEDWARWIGERAGGERKPPRLGSTKHRPLGDAPGDYVREA